jgi:predicted negative regulator of RcsB-dependent stress response
MKRMAVVFTVVVLLAIIGWQRYQINETRRQAAIQELQRQQQAAKEALQELQRLPSRHRKTECASHIGKLTGSKHGPALEWFRPFYDDERPMTQENLKTCLAF